MAKTVIKGQFGTIKDGRLQSERSKKEQSKSQLTELQKFEKQVKDSFLKSFLSEYGSKVDYNSIISAIKFNTVNNNGIIMPSFSFDDSQLIFEDEASGNQEFNESSYQNFISNEDEIAGEAYSQVEDEIAYTDEFEANNEAYYDQYMEDLLYEYEEFVPTSVSYVKNQFKSIRQHDKQNKKQFVIQQAIKKAKQI